MPETLVKLALNEGYRPEELGEKKTSSASSFFPQLRKDIDLYPGVPQANGSPTWVLHDPVGNRFLEIGWLEFEILSRWHLANTEAIVNAVNNETALFIDEVDIRRTGIFFENQQFLQSPSQTLFGRYKQVQASKYGNIFKLLISHYLFFRVPLVRPDTFLTNTLWLVRPLFSKTFRRILVVAALLAIFLVQRQWDVFIRTTLEFLSWDSMAYYMAAVFVAKCVHELGHAYSCKYYGLHVPVIGLAFLVFCPFLYTDTGESWKLTSRKERLHIVIAGMAAEGALAIISTFAWSVLPAGVMRNTAFFLATTSLIMTLLVNVSPFMRWDGYYLLSDLTGIKNLQPRAMAMAKWWLRELIFGFGDRPPEDAPHHIHYFMIFYAIGVWLYRLSIFFGIALLVYHFFIKALGIFLASIEVLWFIWFPVQKELKVWYQKRGAMHWNRHSIISVTLLTLLFFLFFLPWRNYQLMPAVLKPAIFTEFYPSAPARVEKIYVRFHSEVKRGDPLFDLVSPELDFNLAQAAMEIKLSEALLQRSSGDIAQLREQREVAIEQNMKAQQIYKGLQQKEAQLHIRAPFDGTVVGIADDLKKGQWVGEEESLGMLANTKQLLVFAYANSETLEALNEGAEGTFYPENNEGASYPVRITHLSRVNAEYLIDPILASVHHGPIPVEPPLMQGRYSPKDSAFLVVLSVTKPNTSLSFIQRGYVRVASAPRSYAMRVWRNFHSLLIRESGF